MWPRKYRLFRRSKLEELRGHKVVTVMPHKFDLFTVVISAQYLNNHHKASHGSSQEDFDSTGDHRREFISTGGVCKKTLCRVIYILLEGFRYISRGVIIPLEGFRYPSQRFKILLQGFRYLSRGFIIPLEGFSYPSQALVITGGIHISFLGVYNSTGGIQLSFLGVYNSIGGIQIFFLWVLKSSGGIQKYFEGL